MKNGTRLVRSPWMLSIAAVCMFCISLCRVEPCEAGFSRLRADLIQIDGMTAFGRLEKQPVEFPHDTHTEALAGENLDCTACHLTVEGRISLKFMRAGDTNKVEVMNTYHQNCISCHGEMKAARKKAGPVKCDGCHREKPRYRSAAIPMGFDNALHYRHSEAQQKKCEQCHHEYDEKTKKLFYAKGKEGTCRYCHKAETKDNLISMRLASHTACINCHAGKMTKNLNSGPIKCAGCHDAAAREKIKKAGSVPRMERGQPDVVLLKTAPATDTAHTERAGRMNFVPFDHKGHEQYNDTCRVCHHETLSPCNQCHTLTGTREGKGVTLSSAMHQAVTEKSCVGCHRRQQEEKSCAGCHSLMSGAPSGENDSCRKCHMMPATDQDAVFSPAVEQSLTADLLKSRTPVTGTYPEDDIPEKVVIRNLSRDYEAVDFPHRKIVNALVNNINGNRLAGYFHDEQGTICKGCHHHSPASKKPPSCGNCHGVTADGENPLKPGITGAYHQQCIGCHQAMKMTKVDDCTGCHKEKKSMSLESLQ